ncbi:rRNA methyltransferase 1, mitochondrial isoform X1 [Python bivittatus]|uniref:rRNA methyltransferase 1, mitochondrial n=2 Tax=Python bivittatus TaxID=176946 RepID=A0A9F5N079_PYTBI|nr:rRNA methyltransferase 1, mitochondrial isoform X1 [Python bivittatus]XP_025030860.1 rRNA methyltransferase 1, mitochondrial isoform X1 [Python bivittatus]XP_025030861.1 rRNA methyltransferase 1, mitochondrial isoform X1 [Python bivittatus]
MQLSANPAFPDRLPSHGQHYSPHHPRPVNREVSTDAQHVEPLNLWPAGGTKEQGPLWPPLGLYGREGVPSWTRKRSATHVAPREVTHQEIQAAEMEPLHAFNIGFRNAAKLPFVICFISPFKSIRCFSAWKKPPLLEEQPPSEVSKKEITALQAGHSLEKSRLQETHLLNSKPHLGETGHKAGAPQNKSRPNFLTKAVPSTTKEEFRNLRNDDFVSKRKRLQRNLVLPERTKGSEVLFGTAPCSLALGRSKRTFFQLFLKSSRDGASPVAEKFSQYAEDHGIPVKRVHRKVLDALCKGGVHQGVCLEASPLHPLAWQEGPLRRIPVGKGSQCIWLVLERIHDPMNLGAVLRTAHFLGVDGIVTCERNSCSLTPVVSKASSGVMEVFDVFSTDDVQDLLKTKSEEGWEVLGTVGHGKIQEEIPVVSCSDFRWTGPTILLLGNEGYGLSPETKMLCHKMLTIAPGRDLEFGVESLNVSVAAGILLHAICNQRINHHKITTSGGEVDSAAVKDCRQESLPTNILA